jgi:NADPH:quinone reductase-like Zn-dependent oxidoreductase
MWAAAGVGALVATRALIRRRREYDLRGKSVLITGGSRGLGLVMAREFASEGARVVKPNSGLPTNKGTPKVDDEQGG